MCLEDLFSAICPHTYHGTCTSKTTVLFWCILAEVEYSKERVDSTSTLTADWHFPVEIPCFLLLIQIATFLFRLKLLVPYVCFTSLSSHPSLSFQLKLLKL